MGLSLERGAPGDLVIVPVNNTDIALPSPQTSRNSCSGLEVQACPWLSTLQSAVGAGLYSSIHGPMPFVFGRVPPEEYRVFRIIRP